MRRSALSAACVLAGEALVLRAQRAHHFVRDVVTAFAARTLMARQDEERGCALDDHAFDVSRLGDDAVRSTLFDLETEAGEIGHFFLKSLRVVFAATALALTFQSFESTTAIQHA